MRDDLGRATRSSGTWYQRGGQLRLALGTPSFAPPDGLQPGEYPMAEADIDRSQEFRKCIPAGGKQIGSRTKLPG